MLGGVGGLGHGLVDPIRPEQKKSSAESTRGRGGRVRFYEKEGRALSSPGSCGVDLHDVVVGGGQHQDLLRVAVVEHLPGGEGLQARHGHAPLLLLVAAAH